MSNTHNSGNSDEIDLGQLLQLLRNFFKKILLGIFELIHFFKKKAFILIGVVVIGIAAGMALDHFFPKKSYVQEIIIEPNYDSTTYLYDFVEKFNTNFYQEAFYKNFDERVMKGLTSVTIEPIVNYSDILSFHKGMGDRSGSYDILQELTDDIKDNKKYITQFQFHKLSFYFNSNSEANNEFSDSFFKAIKSNSYFSEKLKINTEELLSNIDENKKTISFINEYIAKISNTKNEAQPNETIIVGNEEEIPTVTSLIKEKKILMERLTLDKEKLQLQNSIFNIVEESSILEKGLLKNEKKKFLPIVLFFSTLLFYMTKFVYAKAKSFVEK